MPLIYLQTVSDMHKTLYIYIIIVFTAPARADIVAKIIASMNDLNYQQSCLRFIRTQSAVPTRYILFQMGQRYKVVIIYGTAQMRVQ